MTRRGTRKRFVVRTTTLEWMEARSSELEATLMECVLLQSGRAYSYAFDARILGLTGAQLSRRKKKLRRLKERMETEIAILRSSIEFEKARAARKDGRG